MWVYSSLILPQVVGSQSGRLMALIPFKTKDRETVTYQFSTPQYYKLAMLRVKNIEIFITTEYGVAPMEFAGNTVVRLHFRKVINTMAMET